MDKRQQPATILGHINRLKSIVYTAIHRGIITLHPFSDFSPEKPQRKQLHLTRDELDKLINTAFDTPNRNFTRDMFLFSVFTGICYCDIRNLTYANIVKDCDGNLWIETHRRKIGTLENVRLLDIAVKLIGKYRGMDRNDKLFPILTKESMNRHLKKMAVQCDISRNLTFHCGRHNKYSFPLYISILQKYLY